MAIIGKIREKSTLVLIIIGGAIIAFVLSDLFSSSSGGRVQGPLFLAEVDGETISPPEYEQQLQQAYENYQARTESEIDPRTRVQIKENVWNQMLSSIIIGNERQKLGVKVTTKELFEMVQGDNPHPQVRQLFSNPETGEFSSAAVVQFLQGLDQQEPETKEQWLSFEKALKSNQEMDKYNNLIKKGIYLPSELAAKRYVDNNSKLNFKYVVQKYSSIPDSTVEISEDKVKDYYQEHKEEYEQKASRKMFYAYFPVRPSNTDIEAVVNEANRIYQKFQKTENDSIFVNANSDQRFDPTYYSKNNLPLGVDSAFWSNDSGFIKPPFKIENAYFIHKIKNVKMIPDSVKASHLLVSTQDKDPAQAEAKADSLLTLLEAKLATMSELAAQSSDDPGSATQGGDLGWFTQGTMVKPFNDAAFEMEVGEIRKVRTQFGFHLIQVDDKTIPKRKIQIATIQILVDPSKETYANVFNEANSFSIDATDGESFNELINEKNIQRRVAVLNEDQTLVQGIEGSRDLVRWAQETKEGDISEAFDIGDAFAVGYLEKINESGPAPLEDVRVRVEYMVRMNKKAEQFKSQMSGMNDLGSLASQLGLSVENAKDVTFTSPNIPNMGMEPEVVGKAMSLESGQMSVPIQGKNGVYVIQMEDKTGGGEPIIAVTRNSMERGLTSQIDNGAVFNALKEKSEIEDNRSKFY